MHNVRNITSDILLIGGSDRRLSLFENVFPVPRGVSYNAYLVRDEKTVLLDTADSAVGAHFYENLEHALQGRPLDYVIVNHMEPDHCSTLGAVLRTYPEAQVVASAKAISMIGQFFDADVTGRCVTVKEGDTLSTGRHTLTFVMAPMVHWPEVMATYDATEKVLFSADAFGTFGALNGNIFADEVNFKTEWLPDARRYYTNIVGKYGAQVQALLKKAAGLDIQTICPLHGPVLREDLGHYLGKYDLWSRYEPEEPESVLLAYASIHGNTAQAARKMKEILERKGCPRVAFIDLCRQDQAIAVEEAFRCGRAVFMSPTYDGGLFPAMDHFMAHLRDKTWRKRKAALIENGSWAPAAAKVMRGYLEAMKDISLCPTVHTIQGAVKDCDAAAMEQIAAELLG